MKKVYKKPMIVIEEFSLTQTVAQGCSDTIPKENLTNNNINTCVWELGGGETVFVYPATCTMDGEEMGMACYNNPSEDKRIFRS